MLGADNGFYLCKHASGLHDERKKNRSYTHLCLCSVFSVCARFFFRHEILRTLPDMFTCEKHELLIYLWQHVVN